MRTCNGFRSTGVRDFAAAAPFYWQLGFSLLLVDQRACGDSEGRCITYGVRERRDAQAWCREMEDRFPGLPILLAGVSLGGTTVLMASDELPPSVRAIVADCGFCSPYEQMEYVAYRTVPFEPGVRAVLFGVDIWCRLLAHFRLKEWSAQQALYKTDIPVCGGSGGQAGALPLHQGQPDRLRLPLGAAGGARRRSRHGHRRRPGGVLPDRHGLSGRVFLLTDAPTPLAF